LCRTHLGRKRGGISPPIPKRILEKSESAFQKESV
jgi:hypothetical protein